MHKFTKIIATLGPASNSPEVIESLVQKGVNLFRLNFSHGSHEEHRERFNVIRSISNKLKQPIGIIQDIQGPKLRVGLLPDHGIRLRKNSKITLSLNATMGSADVIPLPHPEIFKALVPGEVLLLVDGKIKIRIDSCTPEFAEATVLVGGNLASKQGVNVPGVTLPISILSEKDRSDIAFGIELGVDWIALSFIQTPEDIVNSRTLIQELCGNKPMPRLIAKLEKPQAIEQLEAIVRASDGIMVARGDLGVELPLERIPVLQKRITTLCRHLGKPVIVATQMLESMVSSPVPTRAEVSDVATAVYDGADAVMLSGESAKGHYPIDAVDAMAKTIREVEQDPFYWKVLDTHPMPLEQTPTYATTSAACTSAEILEAPWIVTYTTTGETTLRTARNRPHSQILALSCNPSTVHQLTLVWGVYPILVAPLEDMDHLTEKANDLIREMPGAQPMDPIVITCGTPFQMAGSTNLMKIIHLKD